MNLNLQKLKLLYPRWGRCQTPRVGLHVPIIAQGTVIGLLFDSIRMVYVAPVFPNMFFYSAYRSNAEFYTGTYGNCWINFSYLAHYIKRRTDKNTSSPPSAAYMRHGSWSALVQIMACRIFSAKPLSKPHWVIVNWNLGNKIQWSFIKIYKFSFSKMRMKMSFAQWQPFCPGEMSLKASENGKYRCTWRGWLPRYDWYFYGILHTKSIYDRKCQIHTLNIFYLTPYFAVY